MRRRRDVDVGHVESVLLDLFVAQRAPVNLELARADQDRVVDVGDVLNVRNLSLGREPAERAHQRIELHKREGVAEMRGVIRRYATHVHLDRPLWYRPPPGREGVVQEEW